MMRGRRSLLQYLVPRECTSRGKCSLAVPSRHDVRASTSSREVEVCVSTLPYRHPHTSNLSKSASTWGSLHKPLMWKVSLLPVPSVHGYLSKEQCFHHSISAPYSTSSHPQVSFV